MSDRREEILGKYRNHILTIEDKDAILEAMDDYMKECCLELLQYLLDNNVEVCRDPYSDNNYFFKGYWITKEQLFENFL